MTAYHRVIRGMGLFVLALYLLPGVVAEGAWQGVSPPAARSDAAMAYDSARGKTVLFGGYGTSSSGYRGDTWEWNGASWKRVAASGPSPRSGAAMAYDSNRGKTVLFGGRGADGYYNDTWEWDGASWKRVATFGPSVRSGSAMAYHSNRAKTVLFGGRGAGGFESFYGDTWEWNGVSWTRMATSGPNVRSGAAIAYDGFRNRTVLFGGYVRDNYGPIYYRDTWEWNGALWKQVATSGPSARDGAKMIYDSAHDKTVLFGGGYHTIGTSIYHGDTWEWDGALWKQVATSGPSGREQTTLGYDSIRGKTVLFGGTGNSYHGDTWEWDGVSWNRVADSGMRGRDGAAMAYDSARGKTVLFGGSGYDGETWEWDGRSWTQVATSGPGGRSSAAMVYDSARGKTVLFGGRNLYAFLGDTWEWDGSSWKPAAESGPGAGEGAAMAYDSARGKTVLFGGNDGGGTYGDTWEWDGVSWKRVATSGPSGRKGAAMAYDSVRGKTILFGGGNGDVYSINACYGDTWEWDGGVWKQVVISGPGVRYGAVMVYDSARDKAVLFGGSSHDTGATIYHGDTWELDGDAWVRVEESGPDARDRAAAAYDNARYKTVLFGGNGDDGKSGDTWEYAPQSGEPYTASDVITALRMAAGIQSMSAPLLPRLDVVSEGASFKRVDMADVVKIARMVSGAESRPCE